MGAALALIPSVLADSFSYKTSDSNVTSNLVSGIGDGGFANGIAEHSPFTTEGIAGTVAARNGKPIRFSAAVDGGALFDHEGIGRSTYAGSSFDNLLNQSNTVTEILDGGGVLVDLSGKEVNLLFGGFSSDTRHPGKAHINFADRTGPQPANEVPRSHGSLVTGTATLTATPEPGSLFLLGTGLLCLALILFRKAAKQSTGS